MRAKDSVFFPAGVVLLAGFLILSPNPVFPQAEFYKGKTITAVLGTSPGGTSDVQFKVSVPFLEKHIPGKPKIVVEYMPGAGGVKAANHIYGVAKPDGLTIGVLGRSAGVDAVTDRVGVFYKLDSFFWLGSSYGFRPTVLATWRDAGLNTIEDLRNKRGIRLGAQTVGHTGYYTARLFAWILRMQDPKVIVGYSGPEMDVALRRGELDGRHFAPGTLLRRNPEWIEKGFLTLHVIIPRRKGEKEPHPAFADLPPIDALARSEKEIKVIETYRTLLGLGDPLVLPPGTPQDRVAILQAAARKALSDPEFHKAFEKAMAEPAEPSMADEIEHQLRTMPRDPEIVAMFKMLGGAGPLPAHK